jgi:probable F420-dependent oxidoreductase
VKIGIFLPISGRAATAETLTQAAQQAENLGYASVWTADRVVIPWKIDTVYPYSKDQQFIVPPDRPFLDSLTCLAFLAGKTTRVSIGMSVLVLPYRHPLYWGRIAATIDQLSKGRLIMGVGVGWMEEEFRALGVSFPDRGRMTDEQIRILHELWGNERCSFQGKFYSFEDIAFLPKPYNGKTPIWVGGEGKRAQRRAGELGDAWFPYFVRITPRALAARFAYVRECALKAGRDPDSVVFNCCLPIELSDSAVSQEENYLKGNAEQIIEKLKALEAVGVKHMALQFMVPRWPERMEQIRLFAERVLPGFSR